jgi:hypothetical protein
MNPKVNKVLNWIIGVLAVLAAFIWSYVLILKSGGID